MNPPLTVKICGLSTPPTLEAALAAGADMVGFVFFAKSPRHIGLGHRRASSAAASRAAHKKSRSWSTPTTERSRDIVAALEPDLLQLHGHETPERVAAIEGALRPAGDEGDRRRPRRRSRRRRGLCGSRRLAAVRRQAGAGRRGARRQRPRLRLAVCCASLRVAKPWLLSGGLDAGNVAEALRDHRAPRRRCLLRRRKRARRQGFGQIAAFVASGAPRRPDGPRALAYPPTRATGV